MSEVPSELPEQLYAQLKQIAQARLRGENRNHTWRPTELVHEAYLKLQQHQTLLTGDRARFFAAAAEAMRRLLIDHARGKRRQKRGGGVKPSILDVEQLAVEGSEDEIVALDEAVRRLEEREPDAAKIVKLRFYAGLSVEETAEALGISPRTVKREWQYARAWLYRELSNE
jgi:RNA polymerase sigma factor (TIGR02999 family)